MTNTTVSQQTKPRLKHVTAAQVFDNYLVNEQRLNIFRNVGKDARAGEKKVVPRKGLEPPFLRF